MSSIWKDLLFLHGHITNIDPSWRPDPQDDAGERKAIADFYEAAEQAANQPQGR